jgi:hypothetical protein
LAAEGFTALQVAVQEAHAIDSMSVVAGRPMRLHTVGDCSSSAAAQIVGAACERYMERGGGQVWSYTHAWRVVHRASWGRVSVFASCETQADVALARERGYAPSIVVDAFPTHKLYEIREAGATACTEGSRVTVESDGAPPILAPSGLSVLPCPAQTHKKVTCSSCRLCMDDQAVLGRGYAIGFEVHGTSFAIKKALQALDDPTNETRKLTSRDFIQTYVERTFRWPSSREVMDGAGVTRASAIEMLNRLRQEAA